MIKFITDSASYIPPYILLKHNIGVLPVPININGEPIEETKISNADFFSRITSKGTSAKPQPPSVDKISSFFEIYLKQGFNIIATFTSASMSHTFSNAELAKTSLKKKYSGLKIEIINSKSICMQSGYITLGGIDKSNQGAEFDEIVTYMKKLISNVQISFIPKTLRYLSLANNFPSIAANAIDLLKIVPVFGVDKSGQTVITDKVHTRDNAKELLMHKLKKALDTQFVKSITVTHIMCDDEAKSLANNVKAFTDEEVLISEMGPVAGIHIGPGALGLIWVSV